MVEQAIAVIEDADERVLYDDYVELASFRGGGITREELAALLLQEAGLTGVEDPDDFDVSVIFYGAAGTGVATLAPGATMRAALGGVPFSWVMGASMRKKDKRSFLIIKVEARDGSTVYYDPNFLGVKLRRKFIGYDNIKDTILREAGLGGTVDPDAYAIAAVVKADNASGYVTFGVPRNKMLNQAKPKDVRIQDIAGFVLYETDPIPAALPRSDTGNVEVGSSEFFEILLGMIRNYKRYAPRVNYFLGPFLNGRPGVEIAKIFNLTIQVSKLRRFGHPRSHDNEDMREFFADDVDEDEVLALLADDKVEEAREVVENGVFGGGLYRYVRFKLEGDNVIHAWGGVYYESTSEYEIYTNDWWKLTTEDIVRMFGPMPDLKDVISIPALGMDEPVSLEVSFFPGKRPETTDIALLELLASNPPDMTEYHIDYVYLGISEQRNAGNTNPEDNTVRFVSYDFEGSEYDTAGRLEAEREADRQAVIDEAVEDEMERMRREGTAPTPSLKAMTYRMMTRRIRESDQTGIHGPTGLIMPPDPRTIAYTMPYIREELVRQGEDPEFYEERRRRELARMDDPQVNQLALQRTILRERAEDQGEIPFEAVSDERGGGDDPFQEVVREGRDLAFYRERRRRNAAIAVEAARNRRARQTTIPFGPVPPETDDAMADAKLRSMLRKTGGNVRAAAFFMTRV